MMAQVIHALIIFVLGYVVTGFVLIEITMWLMRRLDVRAASATGQRRAVEYEVEATFLVQADFGPTYSPEGSMRKTIEADQFGYLLIRDPFPNIPRSSKNLPIKYA